MALSESYESTIIEVGAGFGYSNFECDPAEITRALEITPDNVVLKGEKWVAFGKTRTRPFNSWEITSQSTSKDVNVHLRELLNRLGDRNKLARSHWGTPSFSIVWKNNYLYAGTGPFFEVDVISGIARWKAELYQDIYQIDQEDSGSNG
jgi:hypothetical protein